MKKNYLILFLLGFVTKGFSSSGTINTESVKFPLEILTREPSGTKDRDENFTIIRELYRAYEQATNNRSGQYYTKSCDSIVSKYCTFSFHDKVKDEFESGVGYDWITGDFGLTDWAIKTFSVVKDGDYYKVTYRTTYPASIPDNKIRNITSYIKIKDGKIDDVISSERKK